MNDYLDRKRRMRRLAWGSIIGVPFLGVWVMAAHWRLETLVARTCASPSLTCTDLIDPRGGFHHLSWWAYCLVAIGSALGMIAWTLPVGMLAVFAVPRWARLLELRGPAADYELRKQFFFRLIYATIGAVLLGGFTAFSYHFS